MFYNQPQIGLKQTTAKFLRAEVTSTARKAFMGKRTQGRRFVVYPSSPLATPLLEVTRLEHILSRLRHKSQPTDLRLPTLVKPLHEHMQQMEMIHKMTSVCIYGDYGKSNLDFRMSFIHSK